MAEATQSDAITDRIVHGRCQTGRRFDGRRDTDAGFVEHTTERGVDQYHGESPFGLARSEFRGGPSAHAVAHQDGSSDAELVQDLFGDDDAMLEGGFVSPWSKGFAVAGCIDGDHQESQLRQSAEHAEIDHPVHADAVQKDQWDTMSANRQSNGSPVRELHPIVPKADARARRDRQDIAGRCRRLLFRGHSPSSPAMAAVSRVRWCCIPSTSLSGSGTSSARAVNPKSRVSS
jgi:hypothetical protein